MGTPRIARADGVWVLDARRSPVLACTGAGPTAVGVLIEVPVMLSVVWIVNRSQGWYERGATRRGAALKPVSREI